MVLNPTVPTLTETEVEIAMRHSLVSVEIRRGDSDDWLNDLPLLTEVMACRDEQASADRNHDDPMGYSADPND